MIVRSQLYTKEQRVFGTGECSLFIAASLPEKDKAFILTCESHAYLYATSYPHIQQQNVCAIARRSLNL